MQEVRQLLVKAVVPFFLKVLLVLEGRTASSTVLAEELEYIHAVIGKMLALSANVSTMDDVGFV